jgi:hypothetical protein
MNMLVRWLVPFGLVLSFACRDEPPDLSGPWVGSAHMIVDGEAKDVTLRWDLTQREDALGGTLEWDAYQRQITSASITFPKIRLESASSKDTITFEGVLKNESIEGRFAIKYNIDPEPFPGRFEVSRQN